MLCLHLPKSPNPGSDIFLGALVAQPAAKSAALFSPNTALTSAIRCRNLSIVKLYCNRSVQRFAVQCSAVQCSAVQCIAVQCSAV